MLKNKEHKYNNTKIKYGNLQIGKKRRANGLPNHLLRLSGDNIVDHNFHLICLYYTAIKEKIKQKNCTISKNIVKIVYLKSEEVDIYNI